MEDALARKGGQQVAAYNNIYHHQLVLGGGGGGSQQQLAGLKSFEKQRGYSVPNLGGYYDEFRFI